MAGTGNKLLKVTKILCKKCDNKLISCTSELAVGQFFQVSKTDPDFAILISSNQGGMGWKALTANIDSALVCAVCGMCLTAEGTVV